jgi:hypothetical protein
MSGIGYTSILGSIERAAIGQPPGTAPLDLE